MRTLIVLIALSSVANAATVTELNSPAGVGSAEPFLFASRSGLILSWLEPIPKSDRVALRFARYTRGGWSAAKTVVERNDLFVNWADFPSLVDDGHGSLFAHWLQKSGTTTYAYDVRMAVSSDGGTSWSSPFLLNRDGKKSEHGFVTLAPLPNGGVGAAWLDGRRMPEGKEEGPMTVRYASVDAAGNIHAESELDAQTCECCTTGMTITSRGPVVVYRDKSAGDIRDIAVVRRTNNRWGKPRLIRNDGWKINGCPVNGPQIDSSGSSVVLAWFTAAHDRQRVYTAFSNDGGATFSRAVAADDGKPAGRVDVALLDRGTAVVTWIEQTPQGAELRARVVRPNNADSPSIKVADSSAARSAGFPRMAPLDHEVFIAWTDQTAKEKRIRVARVTVP